MVAQNAKAPQSATRQFTGQLWWLNTVRHSRMNMVICKVGVAAGTTTTGDVMIIPTTQVDINASGANNPLPPSPVATGTVTTLTHWDALSATPEVVPAILAGYAIAGTSTKYVSILAGTDANLGAMTFISNGNTDPATLMQAAPLTATDDVSPLNALSTGATAYNTNAGASTTFDITPASADTANWVIGATKLTALLRTGQAAACTWTNARSVLTVCGDVAGSVIPTDLDMHSGTTVSGTKCTGAFLYTVITTASSVDTRHNRWCRWCNAALATNIVEVFIKDFVPPTTATKLLKGLVTWGQDTNGACQVTKPTRETKYQQKSVVIASGGCGKTGQTVKVSTKGQLVEFTIKSPVPLAAGQFVFWEEVTGTPVTFKPSSIPAGSVSCTCGTYTWAATFAKENITGTNDRMKLTIPNAATGATSEVICAAGDLSCKVREWNAGTTVTEMTATCYACDSNAATCTKAESQTDATTGTKGVARYVSSVTFTFKQDGTASTDVLKVKDVMYQPNSKNAIGRFYYKPSTTQTLYAGSTIAYTFGSQTFGTGAICQVFTSSGNAPSMTHSDLVNKCVISSSSVTVTMAKDATANFHVQITGMDAWLASASNKVAAGSIILFSGSSAVQSVATTATTQYAMAVVGTTTASSNEPLATMTAVVARSLVNVMDVGMVSFTITPKGADWGSNGLAFISFPTYYNPNIGSMMRCALYDTKAKADGERLYCNVAWDYTLRVMGPSTAQKKDAAFELRVYGVQMNLHAAAGNFGVGLTNATYWASDSKLTEFKAAADTTTGVWGGSLTIDVTSISLSSNNLRASTDITMAFRLPVTSSTVMAASDFVAVQLPFQWMGVAAWMDGTGTASASLKLVTTTGTGTAAKTTKTAVKGAVSQVSGCNVVFALDTTATKLAEGSSYEFTLSGVPTAESAVGGAAMALGSVVLSVGKVATGGFGYSSAQMFNALAAQTAPTGKDLMEFSSAVATVSRGTYTKGAVCIQPASGNFKAAVAASVQGTVFKTYPASLSAKMGAANACADMGTGSGTQMSTHNVRWSVVNGTAAYTGLPTQQVTVNGNTATVNVPDKVTCSLGGSSVPIVVTASAVPFADVKISLTTSQADDEKKTD
jgi:hypothetical protein